jgi:hypothetical protein
MLALYVAVSSEVVKLAPDKFSKCFILKLSVLIRACHELKGQTVECRRKEFFV